MNKIIIKIWGGLGNQLFIYAFARLLSEKFKDEFDVVLENKTGFIRDGYKRSYKLCFFPIKLKLCSLYYTIFPFVNRNLFFLVPLLYNNMKIIIEENNMDIESLYNKIKGSSSNYYLKGYWQHINFTSIRVILLEELKFRLKDNATYFAYKSQIISSRSIAIHIRVIDYDVLDNQYYFDAIELMKKEKQNYTFFVFSDDIQYCKRIFNSERQFVFIEKLPNELYDLKLMSLCENFIIANSTFSWWWAYLSTKKDKTVIMPKWYITNNMNGRIITL